MSNVNSAPTASSASTAPAALVRIPFYSAPTIPPNSECKIPRKIYQTWKTDTVTQDVADTIEELKQMNPEYEYYFFSDKECKDYLYANYGQEYLDAFNKLKPGAFKADFWRYAILAKEGGVYIDLDMKLTKPLREIVDCDTDFYVVKDVPDSAIYQAFIAVVSNHPVLTGSTEECFNNIIEENMGDWVSVLSITGPKMMGKVYSMYYTGKENSPIKDYHGGVNSSEGSEKIQMATNTWDTVVTGDHPRGGPYKGELVMKNKMEGYAPPTQYGKMFHLCDVYKGQNTGKCIVKKYYGVFFILLLVVLIIIAYKLFRKNPCSIIPCIPPTGA
jgi:hypothetical protein